MNYSEYETLKANKKKSKNHITYDSYFYPDDPRFSDPNWFLELLAEGNIPKISIQIGHPSFWIPTSELLLSGLYNIDLVISWSKRGLEYVNNESIDANIYLEFYLKMVRKFEILPHRVQTRSEAARLMVEHEDWYQEQFDDMSDEEYQKYVEEGGIFASYLACDRFLDELIFILYQIRKDKPEKGKELYNQFRNHYYTMGQDAIERLENQLKDKNELKEK